MRLATNPSSQKETVVVAGASGFIGSALPDVLGDDYELIGLSRTPDKARRESGGSFYRWRSTDLFSRKQTFEALEGADRAIYLVHSLHPWARLTQGEVGDLDLVCADNFARAAAHHGLKHIIYVSSIVPDSDNTSPYLRSRLEVEEALKGYGTPVTTLRAAFVIGFGGSGTEVLRKLVDRLPVMALPRWAESQFAPVARDDLIKVIAQLLPREANGSRSYDLEGPEVITFHQMLELVAEITGRRRRFSTLPWSAPRLSAIWMSLWSGLPKWQVRPVIESFRTDLLAAGASLPENLWKPEIPPRRALRDALAPDAYRPVEETALIQTERVNDVRAVHRLALPKKRDARWLAAEYARWLPQYFRPLFYTRHISDTELHLGTRLLPWPLLVLELDEEISRDDRQLFWIRRGLLARSHKRGRLEFRAILDGSKALAAIHDFHPKLPWFLYIPTQARVHHIIMRAFNRHLQRLPEDDG